MNMYLNFTFIITCGFYSFLIFDSIPRHNYVIHNGESIVFDPERMCGPFLSNNILSPVSETGLFPSDESVTRIVFCYLLQFSIYTILFMFSRNLMAKVGILKRVQDLKFKEFERKIKES